MLNGNYLKMKTLSQYLDLVFFLHTQLEILRLKSMLKILKPKEYIITDFILITTPRQSEKQKHYLNMRLKKQILQLFHALIGSMGTLMFTIT